MISCDYIIIGAGFAGASTAYHLTRRGMTDILLLEQEAIPGLRRSQDRSSVRVNNRCFPKRGVLVPFN